ncbi:MAG: HAD-IIIA family hydrolase [Candidatus Omnitrophota bacterium]
MRKVIFIDRDGVINKDPGGWTEHNYVTAWEQFIFLPNSINALEKLTRASYDIVLISNQAGVNKGFYTKEELQNIDRKMVQAIEEAGGKIRKAYYCVHQPSDNCNCRKPKTGLFERAEEELNIKAGGNYFIGDGKTDIEAGTKMGLKTIMVLSGKADLKNMKDWNVKPDYIFDDLLEAADFIIRKDG